MWCFKISKQHLTFSLTTIRSFTSNKAVFVWSLAKEQNRFQEQLLEQSVAGIYRSNLETNWKTHQEELCPWSTTMTLCSEWTYRTFSVRNGRNACCNTSPSSIKGGHSCRHPLQQLGSHQHDRNIRERERKRNGWNGIVIPTAIILTHLQEQTCQNMGVVLASESQE